MRSFKLVLGYDGTEFHGWQVQPGQRTVQGVVEEALKSVLEIDSVSIEGAGRTDSGVHARGQVASLHIDTQLPAQALAPLLNARLPADVRIRSVEEAVPGFHARRSAAARRYAYRLLREEDVLLCRYAWYPGLRFDPDRLERALRPLEGEADFAAFRGSGSSSGTSVCRVLRVALRVCGSTVQCDIVADHFLYHMVRAIMGTALAASNASDPAGAMAAVMDSRDRGRGGPTVPARGLCLEEVFYPPEVAS